MSEHTYHAREPFSGGVTDAPSTRVGVARLLTRGRWLIGAAAILGLSVLLIVWARVRPGYDPYGWLVWGHLTLHGKLNTDGAPSWKPLPYLFTLPFSLLGRQALYLWMATAFAVSLTGVVFAWRVACSLVDAPAGRRYAGWAAGLAAAVALLTIREFPHSILSAESDTMIVALCLAAADCVLNRRYRWALWIWWLAALGRPEVWAPLGLYIVWAWRAQPGMRIQLVAAVASIGLLWFGIPALSSHSPFSAATLAENSARVLHGDKITGVVHRFTALNPTAVKVAGAVAVIYAAVRRDRRVLSFAGGVAIWVAVEIAFALHGWSAVPRYLYEAGAGVDVLAGVAVGQIIVELPRLAALRPGHRWAVAGAVAALALVLAFTGTMVPVVHNRLITARRDLRGQRVRASYIEKLAAGVAHVGRARILACGQPDIGVGWQSVLAWELGTNVGVLFYSPASERQHRHPVEHMRPRSFGWKFTPSDWTNARQKALCHHLTYRT